MARRRFLCGAALLPLGGWALAGESVEETAFARIKTELKRRDDRVWLGVKVNYRLSASAREALKNGVALTLETQVLLHQPRYRRWSVPLVKISYRSRIKYQPVSALYLVSHAHLLGAQNFVTLSAALDYLGDIGSVLDLTGLAGLRQGSFEVSVRSLLDLTALPLPLQPLAFLRRDWNQESPWHRWQFSI